jgi:hypothetical protein
MKIEVGKSYKTLNGDRAVIFSADKDSFEGKIFYKDIRDVSHLMHWNLDGTAYIEQNNIASLWDAGPPIKLDKIGVREFWIELNQSGEITTVHGSKQHAELRKYKDNEVIQVREV